MKKVHQLWPKPVFETEIVCEKDWLNFVYDCDYERMKIDNGFYSKDKYILNKLPELKNSIMEQVNFFVHYCLMVSKVQFYFLNSWIVKHNPEDWGQEHIHPNSLLSGVYYLDAPKDSGNIVFVKGHDNTEIFPVAISPNVTEFNYLNSKEVSFSVSQHKLIIFPSTLAHRIEPNKSKQNRYTLAFNLFCKGEFGSHESKLIL